MRYSTNTGVLKRETGRSKYSPAAAGSRGSTLSELRVLLVWGLSGSNYFRVTSRARWLAIVSRISARFFPASIIASREP